MYGFECVIDEQLNIYWCEPNISGFCDPDEILRRLGWMEEIREHWGKFVRVCFREWNKDMVVFDEVMSVPAWVDKNEQEIIKKCLSMFEQIYPSYCSFAASNSQEFMRQYPYVIMTDYREQCQENYLEMVAAMKKLPGYAEERSANAKTAFTK